LAAWEEHFRAAVGFGGWLMALIVGWFVDSPINFAQIY
jgi:hypothetical protein